MGWGFRGRDWNEIRLQGGRSTGRDENPSLYSLASILRMKKGRRKKQRTEGASGIRGRFTGITPL